MKRTRTKGKWISALVAVAFAVVLTAAVAVRAPAGPEKTGGTYDIQDDSLTSSGATDITGSTYWLVFSAGQPVGHEDMAGGTYTLEGGYVSGVIAVFQVTKSISTVEAPVAYTGANTDKVPGSRLTYSLDFENFGEGANDVLLEDVIPANSTFESASIELTLNNSLVPQTDSTDGDSCAYQSATASIHCLIAAVSAGGTGTVSFKTIIN